MSISGVAGTDPALLLRNSLDYQVNTRVINQDQKAHQLFPDGFDSSTKILGIGNFVDKIVLKRKKGCYTYRCTLHEDKVFNEFRVVRFTATG